MGFAICRRLVDEFLDTRPDSHSLTIIITTRTKKKSDDTISQLSTHLRKKVAKSTDSSDAPIEFRAEHLDLTSLVSIQQLSRKLLRSLPKLDVLILNAGYGGFTGIKLLYGIWSVLTDWKYSVTWPKFKESGVGLITEPQRTPGKTHSLSNEILSTPPYRNPQHDEPPLGEVFCSNVFGHYLLTHNLTPLLSSPNPTPGRIIWISSLEAYAHTFSATDIQGLASPTAYESSKRLTDILALTASLPSTSPWTNRFLTPPSLISLPNPSPTNPTKPRIYLAQPGICATAIVPLSLFLYYGMLAAFYIARWLGSPWHTISAYAGACAPVWLALAPQSTLDALEERDGPGKWGSVTDFWGSGRVARTEVEGWGYGGVVGERGKGRKGRMRGARDLTSEAREDFEGLGRECWGAMEELRGVWEERLRDMGEEL